MEVETRRWPLRVVFPERTTHYLYTALCLCLLFKAGGWREMLEWWCTLCIWQSTQLIVCVHKKPQKILEAQIGPVVDPSPILYGRYHSLIFCRYVTADSKSETKYWCIYLSVNVDYLHSYIFTNMHFVRALARIPVNITKDYTLKITERQSTDTFINTVVVFKGTVSTLNPTGLGGPVLTTVHSLVQPIPERSICSCQVNRRSNCQISISHLVRIY
jgi:hypothetical protein